MRKKKVEIEQVDRLFFRANTPFDRFAKTWEVIEGQFPPSAFTVVGAVRAAIAKELGWNGQGRWNDKVSNLIGKDIHELDPLDFDGPFIERDGKTFVPIPQFVVKQEGGFGILRPNESKKMCVTGANVEIHPLGTGNEAKFDAIKSGFIPLEWLKNLLDLRTAKPIEKFWKASDFHQGEYQPGVFLEIGSKSSANERGFFTRQYTRLRDGVTLSLYLQGLDESAAKKRLVTPLGGEGKFATIHLRDTDDQVLPKITKLNKEDGKCRFFIYLATHYRPTTKDKINRINVLEALKEDLQLQNVEFAGSSVGKPIKIGGWDMFRNRPLQLDAFVPAGSVFFFRADESLEMEILAGSRNKVGQFTRFGFGQYLVGTW